MQQVLLFDQIMKMLQQFNIKYENLNGQRKFKIEVPVAILKPL